MDAELERTSPVDWSVYGGGASQLLEGSFPSDSTDFALGFFCESAIFGLDGSDCSRCTGLGDRNMKLLRSSLME